MLIALLSGAASMYLTVRLCLTVGDTAEWHGTAVAVVLGVAVELAKNNYMPMGLAAVRSGEAIRSIGGLWMTALAGLLVMLSLCASIAYLQSRDSSEQTAKAKSARLLAEYTSRLAQIDDAMDRASRQSERLTQLNVITRGKFVEDRMERLANERKEVVSSIDGLRNLDADTLIAIGITEEEKPVAGRPTLFGWDWKTAVNGMIALVLELMTATSLVVLGGTRKSKGGTRGGTSGTAPVEHEAQASTETLRSSKVAGTGSTEVQSGTDDADSQGADGPVPSTPRNVDRYIEVRRGVQLGDVEPKIRDLKDRYGIGQGTASRHLRRMLAEGVVAQRGRGYVVLRNDGKRSGDNWQA